MKWTDGELAWSYTTLDEIDEIAAMLAKESVCEHVYFGPNSPELTREYFTPLVEPMQEALSKDDRPGNHIFTIRAADRFVGQCALVAVEYGDGNFIIGYQLDEPWWRRGFGTRACEFLVWYGFDVLGARRISGDCLATNIGSARIPERYGFQPEGVHRRFFLVDGEPRDNLLYGLLSDELTLDLTVLRERFQSS